MGGNGTVRAKVGKERKLCRAVVGAGYTRPGASCGCRGVAGRRVRRPYEPNTGRQCPTSVPVIRRAGIHPRRPENPLPGCRHHAHHPTTQSPLPHFGCKGRAGKFQRKIPRRVFTLRGIFDWSFFGSFFAKKEQSIAPVRLRLRAGAFGVSVWCEEESCSRVPVAAPVPCAYKDTG